MSKFIKNTVKLAGSATIAQIVSILLAPVQTRIFSPEYYGIYGFFFSIASIFSLLSTARYEFALMAEEDRKKVNNLFLIALIIPVIFSSLLWIFLKYFGVFFVNVFGKADLSPYYGLLPLTVFITGTTTLFKFFNLRNEHFNLVAISNLINSSLSSILMVVFGILGLNNSLGLIYGNFFGTFFAWLILILSFVLYEFKLIIKDINFSEMLFLIKRYRKTSLLNTISSFLNFISVQIPSILLTSLFGAEVNGYYMLGYKVLKMPSLLIGQALSNVFFQSASEAKIKGNLGFLVEKSMTKLINIGLFPILLLTITGHDLVLTIFGTNWGEAGIYMQILGFWTLAVFISSPLSTVLIVLEKNSYFLGFNMVLLVSRILSIYVGYLFNNSKLALLLFAISGVVIYGWLIRSLLMITNSNTKRLLENILFMGKFMIPLAIESLLIQFFYSGNSLLITINTFILGLLFLVILIWKDPEIRDLLLNLLKKKPLNDDFTTN